MTNWLEFILALCAFFLSHGLPLRPANRARLEYIVGKTGFTVLYSAFSLLVLYWLVTAAGRAPYVGLWEPASWQAWLALLFMLAAILIAALAIGRANAFSFGGGSKNYDPEKPGISGWIRHPLLVSIFLWALSHLIANGNLAHFILFGLFAGFAVIGMRIIDRRKKREWGKESWHTLATTAQENRSTDWLFTKASLLRVLAGVVFYLVLLAVHPAVFDVSPLSLALGAAG